MFGVASSPPIHPLTGLDDLLLRPGPGVPGPGWAPRIGWMGTVMPGPVLLCNCPPSELDAGPVLWCPYITRSLISACVCVCV